MQGLVVKLSIDSSDNDGNENNNNDHKRGEVEK